MRICSPLRRRRRTRAALARRPLRLPALPGFPEGAPQNPRPRFSDRHPPSASAASASSKTTRFALLISLTSSLMAAFAAKRAAPAVPPALPARVRWKHGLFCARRSEFMCAGKRPIPSAIPATRSPRRRFLRRAAPRRRLGASRAGWPWAARRGRIRADAFGDSALGLRHGADFAREADLAHDRRARPNGPVAKRRSHGGAQREVGGGLRQRHAAGDVDVDVLVKQPETGRAFPSRPAKAPAGPDPRRWPCGGGCRTPSSRRAPARPSAAGGSPPSPP